MPPASSTGMEFRVCSPTYQSGVVRLCVCVIIAHTYLLSPGLVLSVIYGLPKLQASPLMPGGHVPSPTVDA